MEIRIYSFASDRIRKSFKIDGIVWKCGSWWVRRSMRLGFKIDGIVWKSF